MNKQIWNLSPAKFFVLGARFTFGLWMLYAGVSKWVNGASGFVTYITAEFDKTWSHALLNTTMAWVILVAEPLLALWILSGRSPRKAWSAMTALMFLLLIGQTMLGNATMIPQMYIYLLLCLSCASLSTNES